MLDEHGDVAGATPPVELATPWWQDMRPVAAGFPRLTVLRLLDVEASDHATAVTYVAEGDPGVALEPWQGDASRLDEHPLRMPWARQGGPRRDLEWAAAQVRLTGPPTQDRTWNLSSIWTLPTADGPVWLKCVPPFFEHEAAVLSVLAGGPVPTLLAAEGHRLLLGDLPGRDGDEGTLEERSSLFDVLVELQLSTRARLPALAGAGVPEWSWSALRPRFDDVVARRRPDDEQLGTLLEDLGDRIAKVDACGMPTVLVHGDAHVGNARVGAGRGIWYDWGDSRIASAVQDLAVLLRPGADPDGALTQVWAAAWERAVPGCEPRRGFELARPLLFLVAAVVYQGFCDRIEPSERVYHDRDVESALDDAIGDGASSRP